jgi:mono/diheme cytochrome c family protein
MKRNVFAIIGTSALTLSLLMLNSCKSDADSPGLEYAPDMYRTPSIEPYVDYGEVRGRIDESKKVKLSARIPARNTIPYYGKDTSEVKLMLPYFRKPNVAFRQTHGLYGFDVSLADEYALAAADKNPLLINAKNAESLLTKGKELFTAMCQHCHGEKGDGMGPMVLSKAYEGVVPNYANLANLSDGQMFYSIYYGKGMMGSHGSLLSKKEIWTLIHYVRQFQNKDYGKFDASGKPVMSAVVSDTTAVKP